MLLVWWIVSIYNVYNSGGHLKFIDFTDFSLQELFNRTNLILLFVLLLFLCRYIVYLAEIKLTRNVINVKSIKSADLNINTLILSYFLPCIELYKKDVVYLVGWFVALLIIIILNKGTYFYNPLMKLFGFRYYEVSTSGDVTYLMISRIKLINKNDIKSYSQLTDYVILNSLKE